MKIDRSIRPISASAAASPLWREVCCQRRDRVGGRHVTGPDRGDEPDDLGPTQFDRPLAHLARDHRRQGRRRGRVVEHVEPLVGQITDARREAEPQKRAKREDVVGEAASVGVMLPERCARLVLKQAVEHIWRFRRGGGNCLDVERGEPVGDVGVGFQPRIGAVLRVDEVHGFSVAAGGKELPIRRGGDAPAPDRR